MNIEIKTKQKRRTKNNTQAALYNVNERSVSLAGWVCVRCTTGIVQFESDAYRFHCARAAITWIALTQKQTNPLTHTPSRHRIGRRVDLRKKGTSHSYMRPKWNWLGENIPQRRPTHVALRGSLKSVESWRFVCVLGLHSVPRLNRFMQTLKLHSRNWTIGLGGSHFCRAANIDSRSDLAVRNSQFVVVWVYQFTIKRKKQIECKSFSRIDKNMKHFSFQFGIRMVSLTKALISFVRLIEFRRGLSVLSRVCWMNGACYFLAVFVVFSFSSAFAERNRFSPDIANLPHFFSSFSVIIALQWRMITWLSSRSISIWKCHEFHSDNDVADVNSSSRC